MDYFKVFTIIFMIFITYLLCNIYSDKIKESFAEAEQSIGGVDDANAINTLAQLAKQLMAGGATVPGNLSVKGEIDATGSLKSAGVTTGGITATAITASGDITTSGAIKIKNKWMLGGSGGGSGDDEWVRMTGLDNKTYYGGFAAGKLWTADNTINGRNIFAEIDALKASTIKHSETIDLRLTKGFAPDGSLAWTANNSGHSIWAHGWNGGLTTSGEPNNWVAQFRISKNNR